MNNRYPEEELDVLLSEQKIEDRVRQLANEIESNVPNDQPLLLVGVLKGAFVFMADLARFLSPPVQIHFLRVASYGSSRESSGQVRILYDLEQEIQNEHVILVEDIVDTGQTVHTLLDHLQAKSPASLQICTLLTKPDNIQTDVELDYVGFELPERFVVGYGLDFDESYRDLPYIAALPEE